MYSQCVHKIFLLSTNSTHACSKNEIQPPTCTCNCVLHTYFSYVLPKAGEAAVLAQSAANKYSLDRTMESAIEDFIQQFEKDLKL